MELGDLSAAFPSQGEVFVAYEVEGTDLAYNLYGTRLNAQYYQYITEGFGYPGVFSSTRLNNVRHGSAASGRHVIAQRVVGGQYGHRKDGAFVYSASTTFDAGNNHYIGGYAGGDALVFLNGRICEILAYSAVLTDTQRGVIERYLANKWGVTLAPTASNADAQAWINNVYLNGGTVSTATAAAVNTFANDIESAGLRDRFYRLNLFAGSNLSAALVPLYRGTSLGGTQFGNATDTNTNFVSGDYVETGTSGGLQGNGSNKFLNTGLPMNFSTTRNYHLSAVAGNFTANNAGIIAADTNGDGTTPRFYQGLFSFNTSPRNNVFYNLGTNFVSPEFSTTYANVAFLGSGNASGNTLYANGSSVATAGESGAGTNANTYPIYVFASNNRNVNIQSYANCRISTYSAGAHMTASQASAYNSALSAFRTAMGRA